MRIASIAHALPETELTNEEAIDLFRRQSKDKLPEEIWCEIERRIAFFLNMSGVRRRRVAFDGEPAMDLAIDAARAALAKADTEAADVDLVIYASVARGWLEPSMAVAVQNRLGAMNATSFDILDACAGWIRAMHVAHSMLRSGACRNALIINLEAGMMDYIPFELSDPADIRRFGAAVTLGNAATATLLEHSDADDFYFNIKTFPEAMELCMMPLGNAGNFLPPAASEILVPGKFMANSAPLLSKTIAAIIRVYNEDPYLRNQAYDVIFSHAVAARAHREIAEGTGVPLELHFSTLAEFGNTASATVPLAMSLALDEGRLKSGKRVGIVIGSAGITVGLATFTF